VKNLDFFEKTCFEQNEKTSPKAMLFELVQKRAKDAVFSCGAPRAFQSELT